MLLFHEKCAPEFEPSIAITLSSRSEYTNDIYCIVCSVLMNYYNSKAKRTLKTTHSHLILLLRTYTKYCSYKNEYTRCIHAVPYIYILLQ